MSVSLGVGFTEAHRSVQMVVVGLHVRQRRAQKFRTGERRIRAGKQFARRNRSVAQQIVRHRTALGQR